MVWDDCNIIYLTVQSFSVGFLHGLIGIKHVKTKSGCIYIFCQNLYYRIELCGVIFCFKITI